MKPSELTKEELESLVAQLPYYVAIVDAERRFLWVNRLDPTLRVEDVIGRPFEAFVLDPYKMQVVEAVARALESGKATYFEALGYGRGQHETWYGCRAIPLARSPNGDRRLMMLSHDVTERKLTALALARSEARFRRLVESSPDYIAIIDAERRIQYINHEPPPATGLHREDVLDRPIDPWMAPDECAEAKAVIERVLTSGEPDSFEAGWLGAGRDYRVRVVALPQGEIDGTARALLVSSDITEERRARKQREELVAELDHRVKNTLATILAIAHQTLASTHSVADFLESFEGRLHSLARTHEALSASHFSSVDLASLVRLAIAPFTSDSEVLKLEVASLELPASMVTPLGLTLHELTTNAAKYGALSVPTGRLLVRTFAERGCLVLKWSETEVDQPPANETHGFGLRLVFGLVESQLGGSIVLTKTQRSRDYEIRVPFADPRSAQQS